MGKIGNITAEKMERNMRHKEYMKIVLADVPQEEKKMIKDRLLTTERFTDKVVYFFEFAHNFYETSHEKSRYWYRAMPEHEYRVLKQKNQLECNYYGGLAPYYKYSKDGYLKNADENTHLVEFSIGMSGKELIDTIHSEVKKMRGKRYQFHDMKPEEGTVSIGLGKTGHYKGDAGKVFNELLSKRKITWRLCCYKQKLDFEVQVKLRRWMEQNDIKIDE